LTDLTKSFSRPKVSIIIPVYNHAHRVDSAIHSVLAQSCQDYEIIIINDGSTDNLEEILQQFDNIQLLNHDLNLGRAAARNTGILAARGGYVAFLDADDQWMPQKLSRQINYLEENKDVEVCLTGHKRLMPNGQTQNIPFLNVSDWEKYLLKYVGLSDGSVPMIHRACFDKIGLQDTAFVWHENWDWLLRAANQDCKIGYLHERLSVKRQSQKRAPASIREDATLYFIKKHTDLFRQYGFYGRSAMALKWYNLAIDYFYEKNWMKGNHYLFKALFTHPFQRPGLYFRFLDALLGTSFEASMQKNVFYKRIKRIEN
jgi:glycosyltransferase involved in cell wall biosynthesis